MEKFGFHTLKGSPNTEIKVETQVPTNTPTPPTITQILQFHASPLTAIWQDIARYRLARVLDQNRLSCYYRCSDPGNQQGSPGHDPSNGTKYDRKGSAAPRSRDVSQSQPRCRRTSDRHWRQEKVLDPDRHSRYRWGFELEIRHPQETPNPHFQSEDCQPHSRILVEFQRLAPLLREEHTR